MHTCTHAHTRTHTHTYAHIDTQPHTPPYSQEYIYLRTLLNKQSTSQQIHVISVVRVYTYAHIYPKYQDNMIGRERENRAVGCDSQ